MTFKFIFILFFSFLIVTSRVGSAEVFPEQINYLKLKSAEALATNVVKLNQQFFLVAGQHQFKSLWTRDFAWSSRGLLQLGWYPVVRDHLTLILSNVRQDNLVPKLMDSRSPQLRVVHRSLARIFPWMSPNLPIEANLKPSFMDENQSAAIDSNLLVLLTALEYLKYSKDKAWWNQHEATLVKAYRYYDRFINNNLIVQPPYSDWQDSTKRQGITLYTNLLYWKVSHGLSKFKAFNISRAQVRAIHCQIEQGFYDPASGLYLSMVGYPYIGLDGNLLAIDLGFHSAAGKAAKKLYQNLKNHSLWQKNNGLPGFNTYPDYPDNWISRHLRVLGFKNYHDQLYWSWLTALSAKIALQMGDVPTSGFIIEHLVKMVERDGTVAEVYSEKNPLKSFKIWYYESESPFSWGAAFIYDAANSFGKAANFF